MRICCAKIHTMNWDDLRIFLAIARSGQLLAAARRLGLNHTTVARRLTALEQALSVRLVSRRTTGCELTPAGEELLARTEHMEAEMMQAQASIANKDIVVSGTVRIAAPDGFGVAFLASRLSDLSKRYPDTFNYNWCQYRVLSRCRGAKRISPLLLNVHWKDG